MKISKLNRFAAFVDVFQSVAAFFSKAGGLI